MINASPQTVRAVADALQLAALLDDRLGHSDDARIAAWSEQIHRHKLARDDLMDGVQAFYDSPSERALGIGDLVHHARYVKRNRLDKELDEQREDRQEAFDIKAVDEMRGLAAVAVLGPVANRTPRLQAAENALQCVFDKHSAKAAIAEHLAAKREASGKPAKASA